MFDTEQQPLIDAFSTLGRSAEKLDAILALVGLWSLPSSESASKAVDVLLPLHVEEILGLLDATSPNTSSSDGTNLCDSIASCSIVIHPIKVSSITCFLCGIMLISKKKKRFVFFFSIALNIVYTSGSLRKKRSS